MDIRKAEKSSANNSNQEQSPSTRRSFENRFSKGYTNLKRTASNASESEGNSPTGEFRRTEGTALSVKTSMDIPYKKLPPLPSLPSQAAGAMDIPYKKLPPLPSLPSQAERASNREIKNNTSLHIAAKKGDSLRVKALLVEGMDINSKDQKGRTALHCAAKMGFEEVVKVLISYKADITLQNLKNRTALEVAINYNWSNIQALLEGSSLNLPQKKLIPLYARAIANVGVTYMEHQNDFSCEILGSGALNTVFKLTMPVEAGHTIEVLKPEIPLFAEGGGFAQMLGINPNDPKTCFRNMLYCEMAYQLRLDIVPHARLGIYKNSLYTTMILAEGSMAAGKEVKVQVLYISNAI